MSPRVESPAAAVSMPLPPRLLPIHSTDCGTTTPVGAQRRSVMLFRGGALSTVDDWVAEEVPVAIEVNGIAQAVMLATPLDLDDFALGFALTEGLIDNAVDLHDCEEARSGLGITLQLQVASSAFMRLKQRRRTLAGRTGCGLCGSESLDQVMRDLPALAAIGNDLRFASSAIASAFELFGELQALQRLTGAVHAAAWCDGRGQVVLLREDVGRHNALDKLIGAMTRAHIDPTQGFIAVTSRASFEMVQKAVSAGAPLLAAVSAPTSLAVTTAERLGLTLVGFARQRDMAVYSRAERVEISTPGTDDGR